MLNPNLNELTVSSQIGMAGGCTVEFGKISYSPYTDPEDGETYIEFEPKVAKKWVWFLEVNGVGITAHCGHEAHKPCPSHFLEMVEKCAILALNGERDQIVQIIQEYKTRKPFSFLLGV
jgi:hypothetical protein